MSPERQRVVIAEACGYEKPDYQPFKETQWFSPEGISTLESRLPNYPADLNAMHEAWLTLTDQQRFRFRSELSIIAHREGTWTEIAMAKFGPEAFLKTIGKWEDGQ